jgi:hypothetical protein
MSFDLHGGYHIMCKAVNKENAKRWNQAIEDAEDTISKCERKIESMKAAIVTFKQARDEGAPYPASQSSVQTLERQHSV